MTSASDIDGYKLTYTYNAPSQSWQPYRVKSVTESDGSALGGSLTFSNNPRSTSPKNNISALDVIGKKEVVSATPYKIHKPKAIRANLYSLFHPFSCIYINFSLENEDYQNGRYYEIEEAVFMEKMEQWGVDLERC